MTIRVVVADDQALVRSGFTMLLAGEPDIEVVGEAGNGAEAVALAASERPDVMLMDVRMPVMDGLEATRRITGDESLAGDAGRDPHHVRPRRVRARGAARRRQRVPAEGHAARSTCSNAVRVVADGDALIAPRITRRLIEEFARRPEPACVGRRRAALEQLTDREREVLELVARGPVERRDRRRAVREPRHREDPRQPAADEARRPRPGPARDDRLRDRRRLPGAA